MGTAICTLDEIYDAFENALDSLQGEVYTKDAEESFNKILCEYTWFTDRQIRENANSYIRFKTSKEKFTIGNKVEYKPTKTESVAGTIIGIYTTTFGSKKKGTALRLLLDKKRLNRKITSVSAEKCIRVPNFKTRR